MGKRNQRRTYEMESSAPKRRRTGEMEHMALRNPSGDGKCKRTQEKRKEEEPLMETDRRKKRKTQTIMDKILTSLTSMMKVCVAMLMRKLVEVVKYV